MTLTTTTVVAVALAGLLGAGCSINLDAEHVTVREEKRFTVRGTPELHLRTFDGSIRVQGSEGDEVLVEVVKRSPERALAEKLVVNVSQEGSRLTIEAPAPDDRAAAHLVVGVGVSTSVSFVVSVPRKVKLVANTEDGSIVLGKLEGEFDLSTGDGSIRGDGLSGRLKARTADGSLRLVDVAGSADLESGDGSIHIEGRIEHLRAHTGDGSVVIEAGRGSHVREDWDVATRDGSVVLRVGTDFSAELDAASGEGSVRSTLGAMETSGAGDRQSLRGRLGGGGKLVRLRSGDGSIRITER